MPPRRRPRVSGRTRVVQPAPPGAWRRTRPPTARTEVVRAPPGQREQPEQEPERARTARTEPEQPERTEQQEPERTEQPEPERTERTERTEQPEQEQPEQEPERAGPAASPQAPPWRLCHLRRCHPTQRERTALACRRSGQRSRSSRPCHPRLPSAQRWPRSSHHFRRRPRCRPLRRERIAVG